MTDPAPRGSGVPEAALDLPRAALLGHAGYQVLVTAAGTGGSWSAGHALARWRPDPVEDRFGWFVHLADRASGTRWSLGLAPGAGTPDRYASSLAPGRMRIERVEHGIEATLDVAVDPDAACEVRRITLRNPGPTAREVAVAGAFEVALHHPAADAHHPAFAKLFVQTESAGPCGPVLARRRPRGHDDVHPWIACAAPGAESLEWETDRVRLVGRGRTWAAPAALDGDAPLAGTTGNVLDPVMALRRTVTLAAGGEAIVDFALNCAPTRELTLALAAGADPAAILARAAAAHRARLEALGIDDALAERAMAIAAAMLAGAPALRSHPDALARTTGVLSELLAHGVDVARPLAVARVGDGADGGALEGALAVQRLAQAAGFPHQLLIVAATDTDVPAGDGIIVWREGEITPGLIDLALAAAQWDANAHPADSVTAVEAVHPAVFTPPRASAPADGRSAEPLRFWNGFGGFSEDGLEYVIRIPPADGRAPQRPPMPWVNVIANEQFGFLVSESGAASTWGANSREHRLTPWSNDALLDPHGEAMFVCDLDAGAAWSPLPGPRPGEGGYEVRHGLGVSTFHHASRELESSCAMFVARDTPVRIASVTLANRSVSPRRVALLACQRLVLGALPEESARFVRTAIDADATVAFARNPTAGPFAHGVAFAAAVTPRDSACSMTTDREAFIGRGGSMAAPHALADVPLDGRAGAGLDPCFAIRIEATVAPGGTFECAFLLGESESEDAARRLVAGLRESGAVARTHDEATAAWRALVSRVRIETPEPALDLMVNAWLPYQTLACRMWGRTAFYQSSGAYGYRDQLQDALSLVPLRPDLARAQIVLHAAHQFVEGDVLHWWHPPADRGMRTRFVDDLLWLPWLAATYVRATGDHGVLDEVVPFVTARELEPGEDEAFVEARDAGESADVYEHACRAIDRSLATGAHGLPLFGCGDWNDGMNRVGRGGRGESVWMGFFLHAVIGDFLPFAQRRGDATRVARWSAHREDLRDALESAAWDGDWYRRGYYDDGTPLGTRDAAECRIDGLVQAWSVLSGAAPLGRAHRAMDSGERLLVSERDGLIRLLTPAFQDSPHDPGYIQGYVRGVRENGGQYTHGVLWFVRAAADLGWRDRAARWLTMLSPVSHARTPEEVARYQVEPYVVAADVYGEAPHVGRGGWTWYTGSSGWMHRVALESVLGLTWHGGTTLRVSPRVPDAWPGFRARLHLPGDTTAVEIEVYRASVPAAIVTVATLDGAGARIEDGVAWIDVPRDGATHTVRIELGDGAPDGAPVAMTGAAGAAGSGVPPRG